MWCIKLILYRLSNRGLQAAVLQRGAGTHCHTVTMLQPSRRVTCHTCLPTPWSPGPVIVADTRRSCSCGAFCLGWLTLSRAAVTCARVGSWSRVTCHRGEAGAASRSAPQVTPAPAGTCGHWRGCSLCCVTTRPPHSAPLLARLGQVSWRLRLLPVCGSSGPLRRMRAAVLVTTDTADCTAAPHCRRGPARRPAPHSSYLSWPLVWSRGPTVTQQLPAST